MGVFTIALTFCIEKEARLYELCGVFLECFLTCSQNAVLVVLKHYDCDIWMIEIFEISFLTRYI